MQVFWFRSPCHTSRGCNILPPYTCPSRCLALKGSDSSSLALQPLHFLSSFSSCPSYSFTCSSSYSSSCSSSSTSSCSNAASKRKTLQDV
ncbi:hypothetical protein E2C01_093058 [Portunus trituberculatus]|uniref:Uncharacterized protein n=1 Tax=Portunus trituberculatus TaxID=210409 RepID=A0A5B7JSB5_PORTR|nr:hypothetical protein [Portunus trituberculatus]